MNGVMNDITKRIVVSISDSFISNSDAGRIVGVSL